MLGEQQGTRSPTSLLSESPNNRSGRPGGIELVGLAVLTLLVALAYVWTKAPLYNPRATIDPWLYTALWTNFGQIYHAFVHTYYASRVPWVIPGYVANALFSPRAASIVVHTIFFFVGAAAIYAVCRRFLSWQAAAVAYVVAIGSQMYFSAHRWDYEEGAVLTYAALAASLVVAGVGRRGERTFLALSGFFAAALVTTQLLDAVLLLGLPLLYVAARERRDRSDLQLDLAWFAGGALVLVLVCGIFARANGGRFLFFMPQIKIALTQSGEANQQPPHVWVPQEPYFFTPLFVIVLAAIVGLVWGKSARAPTRRFLWASAAWTAGVYGVLCLWEFLGSGFFFEYVWYFSAFILPMSICLAAIVQTVCERAGLQWLWLAAIGSAVAVLAPLVWVYRGDQIGRVAYGTVTTPYVAFTVAMVISVVLLIAARIALPSALAVTGVLIAVFAVSYALDASYATWVDGQSDPNTGSLYDLGQQEVAFVRGHGFPGSAELPRFWYDLQAQPYGVIESIQSLYYFSYTYVGLAMPKVDDDFRARMKIFDHPSKLVVLCTTANCEHAPDSLRRSGYRVRVGAGELLHSGALRVWAYVYELKRGA